MNSVLFSTRQNGLGCSANFVYEESIAAMNYFLKPLLFVLTLASCCAGDYQVISKGELAGTYQAFTDICRLKNDDLLCVFYAGYGHVSLPRDDCPKGGRICSVLSTNEGKTWSTPRILFDGPFDDRDPHIAQMRDGTVVCSFFTYRPQPGDKVLCDTSLVTSRDGGKTWEPEAKIVAAGWASSAPVRELPAGMRMRKAQAAPCVPEGSS